MNPSEVRSAEIKWGVSHQCLVVVVRLYIAPPPHHQRTSGRSADNFRTNKNRSMTPNRKRFVAPPFSMVKDVGFTPKLKRRRFTLS